MKLFNSHVAAIATMRGNWQTFSYIAEEIEGLREVIAHKLSARAGSRRAA